MRLNMDMHRYLDLFLSEAREHLNAAYELELPTDPDLLERASLDDLLRHVHSVKGMAATLGFRSMVTLAHAMEEELGRLRDEGGAPPAEFGELMRDGLACLGSMLDRIETGDEVESTLAEDLAAKLRQPRHPAPHEDPAPPLPRLDDTCAAATTEPDAQTCWRVEIQLDEACNASTESTVVLLRRISTLGRLADTNPPMPAEETGRFSGRLGFTLDSTRSRAEIEGMLGRLDGIAVFSLTREAATQEHQETTAGPTKWVRVRADLLDSLIGDLLALRQHQGRLKAVIPEETTEAQQHLMRCDYHLRHLHGTVIDLRLVPFDFVAHRLHQTVHELAAALGKDVDFKILGGSVCLDRGMLDALVDPLMHIVKNCLDHGLESPADRSAAGKPERGTLRLRLDRRPDSVCIAVEDDGRGMDPDRIRRRAIELGMIDPDELDMLDDEAVLMLTARPGFTTALRASLVSGRGVGLDVVHDTLRKLGGSLRIGSTPGSGCRFVLSMPPGQALIRTLLVRSAGALYAVPIDAVQRTVELSRLAPPEPGLEIEAVFLHDRLGVERSVENGSVGECALVCGEGPATSALVVDEVLGRRNVVVRPFRGPLSHLRYYSGAALLEDGAVALVLDPSALLS